MDYYDEKVIGEGLRLVRNDRGLLFLKKTIDPASYEIYQRLREVNNAHIVKIFEIDKLPDGGFEVTEEYVDGITLYNIAQNRRFTCDEIRLYASEVCSGVMALHARGIIHRDITYNNVLLSQYGEIKIIDFDISRINRQSGARDTRVLGTPGFAAPEQYGFAQSDERTDVYAIGHLMDFMLRACAADEDKRKKDILVFIAQKCMRLSPADRFKSVKELSDMLAAAGNAKGNVVSVGRFIRYTYYTIMLLFFVLPVLLVWRGFQSVYVLIMFFIIMIFPVMMFGNDFDWQRLIPEFKYANKGIKIFVMVMVYLGVLMCVVTAIAVTTAIRGN